MPYELQKVDGGYKVGKRDGSKKFSKKPLSKKKAVAQQRAMYANESKGKTDMTTLQESLQTIKEATELITYKHPGHPDQKIHNPKSGGIGGAVKTPRAPRPMTQGRRNERAVMNAVRHPGRAALGLIKKHPIARIGGAAIKFAKKHP